MGNFITVFLLFVSSVAFAQPSGKERPWLLSSSAAAREAKRFTLHEWLENKDRRNMMDMWLSMNTPSPYEFVVGGSLQSYETSAGAGAGTSYKTYHGEVSAYARFIGLTLEHANNTEEHYGDTTGIFNLRLFGETVQGSHLTLHYGLRTRIESSGLYRLNQPFPAVTLQIYIMKYFGIQGNYRAFSPVTESFFGDTTGDELTYGGFLEFGLLRLFGDIYQERQNSTLGGVETNYKREGTRVGLKFFF